MVLCIIVYQLERLFVKGLPKTPKKLYWIILIPAICDAIASFLMGVGLLWVSGSIWQMLRGSIILFTALLKVTYRRKKLWANEWIGVGVVVCAICIIGASTFLTPGEIVEHANSSSSSLSMSGGGVTPLKMAIGIGLVVGAQFL
jgi:drug/metabolite transporter (DMT)-like permease